MKQFITRGEPQVWMTAAALTSTLLMALILVLVVIANGLGTFWPARLTAFDLSSGQSVLGEVLKEEPIPGEDSRRIQLKVGNRDLYGLDFRWIREDNVIERRQPDHVATIERQEYGNFYGILSEVVAPGVATTLPLWQQLEAGREMIVPLQDKLDEIDGHINDINREISALNNKDLLYHYRGVETDDPKRVEIAIEISDLKKSFAHWMVEKDKQNQLLRGYYANFTDINGRPAHIALSEIVRSFQPNDLNVLQRAGIYLNKLIELFVGEPRESNTEGGLFPAIYGTVLLIFVMSLFSFPLGVIAAIYLSEYAGEGLMVRLVRIAVNNLAGIPSIVYGIFGLGFFIYGIGSGIDQLFFPERLPTPTFGTGGLLWASLTLALLTVPVVIVTTEEALGAIPGGIREGSLALGSTRFQTLTRILLPMASPGIMTGLILSMARAAGEVAPLMITGVVKLAPSLPLDGEFPYFHLERKFMHLGFHIYDIGFQSPNVEAARPMVFVTTLLLVLIVIVMSGVAIRLRNHMKKKYTFGTF
nr:phosphate ABC transporter permease PstA [uncultured Desulfuromonas sp.]